MELVTLAQQDLIAIPEHVQVTFVLVLVSVINVLLLPWVRKFQFATRIFIAIIQAFVNCLSLKVLIVLLRLVPPRMDFLALLEHGAQMENAQQLDLLLQVKIAPQLLSPRRRHRSLLIPICARVVSPPI